MLQGDLFRPRFGNHEECDVEISQFLVNQVESNKRYEMKDEPGYWYACFNDIEVRHHVW